MDNITHTLAGLVVAEAAIALRSRKELVSPGLARAAWLSSALANNVPDVDFLYAPITDGPLGYMLHHRGHTHTFLLAPLIALVPFFLARVLARRSGEAPSRSSDGFLYALAAFGCVLHIVMDAGNSYGVHPFWPLSGRWHYGDTIFIVEPAWWLTLAIPLALTTRSKVGRGLLVSIAALALALPIVTGLVSSFAIAGLAFLALALLLVSSRVGGDGARAAVAIFTTLAVAFAFANTRLLAEGRARAALDGAFSSSNEIDLVMSPEPGNPLCWNVLAVSVEGDAGSPDTRELVLRRLVVAPFSSVHPVARCRMVPAEGTTADDVSIERRGHVDVRFFTEARVSVAALRRARAERCDVAAFLRIARAPYLAEYDGERVIGDYRFDRDEGLSFTDLVLEEPLGACPDFVPGWDPPRSDVLEGTYPPEALAVDRWE